MKPIRWGILGTGDIANQLARALNSLDDSRLVAVGSRNQDTADAFAETFRVERAHPTYAALAADPDVDVIYIATPHAMHMDNSILCLEAGKPVLCEKPFAINTAQAERVIAVARKQQRFIMEAMWTRFMPTMHQALQWIAEGAVGEVRMVQAAFGFQADSPKLFDPTLGGGSLLDVGIYPVTLAHLAFGGTPANIRTLAHLGRNGVDELAAIIFQYPNGGLATLSSAITCDTPFDAHIMGSEGTIRLYDEFWDATKVSLQRGDEDPEALLFPHPCNGYEYEVLEVNRCLRAGLLESDVMPHATTLEIMKLLDTIRAEWGLRYPME
jgi:predicted dehydrogenase